MEYGSQRDFETPGAESIREHDLTVVSQVIDDVIQVLRRPGGVAFELRGVHYELSGQGGNDRMSAAEPGERPAHA